MFVTNALESDPPKMRTKYQFQAPVAGAERWREVGEAGLNTGCHGRRAQPFVSLMRQGCGKPQALRI